MRILIVQAVKDEYKELEQQLLAEGHTTMLAKCSTRYVFTNNHGQDMNKVPAGSDGRWWNSWETIDVCLYEDKSAWTPLHPGNPYCGKEFKLP